MEDTTQELLNQMYLSQIKLRLIDAYELGFRRALDGDADKIKEDIENIIKKVKL